MANERSQSAAPWWQVVLVLLGLVALLIGLFYAMGAGLRRFAGLDPTVGAALVAGSATVIVSVLTVFAGRAYERRRIVEENLRSKKIDMYQRFLAFWFDLLHSETIAQGGHQQGERADQSVDAVAFFRNFMKEMMVWSSDEFLREWSRFYRKIASLSPEELSTPTMMFEFETILLAIRKEFGHKNNGIKRGDILGTFINDIDEYLSDTAPSGSPATVSQGS